MSDDTTASSAPHGRLNDRILFGAAFYDEYRRTSTLERDLDLMVQAGFSVIRVGESVWSTWEPSPGVFDLEWLAPVLDAAHERGLHAILGTPTYAVPAWLSTRHPEIAAESATGRREPWGWRQEVDITAPAFLHHAERVIRKQVERYADHPAIIGFQVDNEPGLHLLHNPAVQMRFADELAQRYGTIDELNRQWGLTFWSHRLRSFSELWAPEGNHSPQYQLEWRRFQTRLVDEFIAWQAAIVREYSSPGQFITTCISYERPAVNDVSLTQALDVTAGNPYYKMQDALHAEREVERPETWWSSGVWGLIEQGDRMFSSRQERFLVTETNAQSIGQSHWEHHTPYPGQIEAAGLALISRGARMLEYWQWQTLHTGIETYWGSVLPHSGHPGRIYREVAGLGSRLRGLEPHLVDYQPDADITLLHSTDTKRSFQFYPPLALPGGGPDRDAYLHLFDAYYRGAFDAGLQTRILHTEQLPQLTAEDLAREHPVLVVPSAYVASDELLDQLADYARAGGHLIAGIRTGYGDQLARARPERAPARIGAAAGIWYDEYSSLDRPCPVLPVSDQHQARPLSLSPGAAGTGWADGLVLDGAQALALYEGGLYAGHPAVTTHEVGRGRLTYVGTVPNRDLAHDLMAWALPSPTAGAWGRDAAVTVASGTAGDQRVWFVTNWSDHDAVATIPASMVELRTDGGSRRTVHSSAHAGRAVAAGEQLVLSPWTVHTFTQALSDIGSR